MSDISKDYSFGGWLKHFRIEKGIGVREAARLLKTDPGNYCNLENSRINPPNTRKKISKICDSFGLNETQRTLLVSTGFSFHFGELKRKFDE